MSKSLIQNPMEVITFMENNNQSIERALDSIAAAIKAAFSVPFSDLAVVQLTNFTAFTTATDITGWSNVIVSVPANRRVHFYITTITYSTVIGDLILIELLEDGIVVDGATIVVNNNNYYDLRTIVFSRSPTPGSHTYKIRGTRQAGTGTPRLGGENATNKATFRISLV
jgi:hypothetical protein